MDLTFSSEAATFWAKLSDLERTRAKLALRRVALKRVTSPAGEFEVKSYDLLLRGTASEGGNPILVSSISNAPLSGRYPRPGSRAHPPRRAPR